MLRALAKDQAFDQFLLKMMNFKVIAETGEVVEETSLYNKVTSSDTFLEHSDSPPPGAEVPGESLVSWLLPGAGEAASWRWWSSPGSQSPGGRRGEQSPGHGRREQGERAGLSQDLHPKLL